MTRCPAWTTETSVPCATTPRHSARARPGPTSESTVAPTTRTTEAASTSPRTAHGENIADQIAGQDAYGRRGTLILGDVVQIVDQIHTNLLDGGQEDSPLMAMVTRWLDEANAMIFTAKEAA